MKASSSIYGNEGSLDLLVGRSKGYNRINDRSEALEAVENVLIKLLEFENSDPDREILERSIDIVEERPSELQPLSLAQLVLKKYLIQSSRLLIEDMENNYAEKFFDDLTGMVAKEVDGSNKVRKQDGRIILEIASEAENYSDSFKTHHWITRGEEEFKAFLNQVLESEGSEKRLWDHHYEGQKAMYLLLNQKQHDYLENLWRQPD